MSVRDSKRKLMAEWIHEAMIDDEKTGKLRQLRLVHMEGMQEREIHVVTFGTKPFTPDNLAKMLRGKAEVHVQDMAGAHLFRLQALYGERTEPEAYFPFGVNSEGDHSGGWTEPPTEQGRLMQAMRHSEMLVQQTYRRQQALDELTLNFADRQAKYVEVLETQNREMFVVVKDMLMKASLNQHEYRVKELAYARETEERAKFLSYAPALINTILGREIFPQNNADTALIDTIAESLSEEDIMKLAGMVPPELMGPLANRVEQALAKKRRKDEERAQIRAMAANHPDPEQDAAGEMPRPLRMRAG